MKLLTLNCHSWQEEDQLDKIRILAETIAAEDYDVAALQEVSQLASAPRLTPPLREGNFLLILLEELKKITGRDYHSVWDFAHIGFEVYEEGAALISKHPIKKKHSFFVSQSQDPAFWKTRKVVGAAIEIDGKLMNFYSCHLGWWEDEEEPFQEQADRLLANLSGDGTHFLIGDFNNNAGTRDQGYDYLISKGLRDTYELAENKDTGITVEGKIAGWDKNTETLRIDLILASQPIKIKSSTVIFNGTNRPVISDHFGVQIEF
ncbi:endonuclease/exonuclease/phosphatase family protein [Peribacillus sp. SCS-26]|uniref:endonuclease/exonuclease/phosphatase family protein n=1 Tax=Paraperibacillus marinus TaxID=3115295 RepID=UPI003906991C